MAESLKKVRRVVKFWLKVLVVILALIALSFFALNLFFALKGKEIAVKKLEELTHKKVNIQSLTLKYPLNLTIKGLDIQDFLKADYLSVSPSVLAFLTGRVAFNEIKMIKPVFRFEKQKPAPQETSPQAGSSAGSPGLPPTGKRRVLLIFKHIAIKDGSLSFTDHSVGTDGLKIEIKDLNFYLDNLFLMPKSIITNFAINGRIPWLEGKEEGVIAAEGWINLFKRDIQATVKIEGIDGIYLYPYYANWVDLEKARIERAKLNFTSDIHGLNNDIAAQCRLELTDIVRRQLDPGEEEKKAAKIADVVLEIFRALNQGKVVLDFTIHTKMDSPQFGFENIRLAFEDKVTQARRKDKGTIVPQELVVLPVNLVESFVKGVTDLSRAIIDGAFSVGNTIKKGIEGTLKNETAKQEPAQN